MFDQSSFAKFSLLGRDAKNVLQRICAGDVASDPGHVTYTAMLNQHGGIECDLTVTHIAEDHYYIVTGTGFATHDFNHIKRHIPDGAHAALIDVTSAYGVLSLMGPRSRQILEVAAEGDVSAEAFPFFTVREIQIGGAPVRALRVTYMGELGWELHIPTEYMLTAYETLTEAGAAFGLMDAGYRAIDSLRLEKGYRAWAADISPDYTPLEAGLRFAVAFDKTADFIGRDALLRQRDAPLAKRLVTLTAEDDPELLLTGRETILRDGERVGWLSSGGYGHTIGKHIGLGYVRHADGVTTDYLRAGTYRIESANRQVNAELHLGPLYDPDNSRVRN